MVMPVRNVVYFPGSTIGNFEHDMAMELLRVMHHEAGKNGALLIGVDLQKGSADHRGRLQRLRRRDR